MKRILSKKCLDLFKKYNMNPISAIGRQISTKSPDRIVRILKLVEKYWKKNPDQRLGQLIGNLSEQNDSYFMSDELLEQKLIICDKCGENKETLNEKHNRISKEARR